MCFNYLGKINPFSNQESVNQDLYEGVRQKSVVLIQWG